MNIYSGLSLGDKVEPYLEGKKNANVVLKKDNWKVSGLENRVGRAKISPQLSGTGDGGTEPPVSYRHRRDTLGTIHASFKSRKVSRENAEARKLANSTVPDRLQHFSEGSI